MPFSTNWRTGTPNQANELADGMAQKIEPLMMLFMGVVVGGLVIAMYLPIFNLGAAMN
ncbi:hypothetical protein O1V66_14315 [Rouxiella chamberiensis]|uniref:Type II secretion system protein GspF domain-containing protein n=1 Tax=Rouxiella chamberiensis TaxID=1513468 RepID=A0ABY7HLA5_9GAMM|nr:hypothetical protein [Rouxiella chamberiensis]WAT00155.1 hypothetical protein O1V66_14315 [Rouxiella chamberiensis]